MKNGSFVSNVNESTSRLHLHCLPSSLLSWECLPRPAAPVPHSIPPPRSLHPFPSLFSPHRCPSRLPSSRLQAASCALEQRSRHCETQLRLQNSLGNNECFFKYIYIYGKIWIFRKTIKLSYVAVWQQEWRRRRRSATSSWWEAFQPATASPQPSPSPSLEASLPKKTIFFLSISSQKFKNVERWVEKQMSLTNVGGVSASQLAKSPHGFSTFF